jgi:hypothetical protein
LLIVLILRFVLGDVGLDFGDWNKSKKADGLEKIPNEID